MSDEQPTSEGRLAGSVPVLLCHTALPKMWNSVDVDTPIYCVNYNYNYWVI